MGFRGILSRRSALALSVVIVAAGLPSAHAAPFINSFTATQTIASTVPANGDVNPYGTAVIPADIGSLKAGNVLVSNFNNSANLQGQGTTIVQVTPAGGVTTFATLSMADLPGGCPGGVGLTTALTVLKRGWVIVGSLPTQGSNTSFSGSGCLIVLDANGNPVTTFHGRGIRGPWDSAALDYGSTATLFVSNVLNGGVTRAGGAVVNAGTILRIQLRVPQFAPCVPGYPCARPTITSETIIGSGFSERTDPAALIVGPTGLGFDCSSGMLYVADTVNNRIAAIPNASTRGTTAGAGTDVASGMNLNQPLGLALAPNGDILTVNAADGNIVETTPAGVQVATFSLIANGGGDLFGLAVAPGGSGVYFVNDGANTLELFH